MSQLQTAAAPVSAMAAALGNVLSSGKLHVASRIEQVNTSSACDKNGWVHVLPMTPKDVTPRLMGLLVDGMDQDGGLRARYLVVARHAPTWFHEDVLATSKSGSGKQYRVWVSNRHPNGATAFVLPSTKTQRQADVEWERRKAFLDGKPMSYAECSNPFELMEYFYHRVCDQNKFYFHSFDASTGDALAITQRSNISRLSGALEAIKHFDEIVSGKMSLTDAIQRYARHERVMTR